MNAFKLNNEIDILAIGLGTWQMPTKWNFNG